MAGFFDGFDSALGEAVAEAETQTGFYTPDAGTYNFEVLGAEMKVGTKANPDALNFIVHYSLTGDDGEPRKWDQWLGVPQPADPRNLSEQDRIKFSVLKQTLMGLGVAEADINTVGPDDVEGVTGTLQIAKSKNKRWDGADPSREYYTNARNIKADTAAAPAAPAQVTTKPASRKAAPKAQPSEGAGEVQKPQATAAVGNPFAR
jgi:hypothetical protein